MRIKLHPDLESVLQTAKECHNLLADKKLCHVIIGGLAVYLHGHVNRDHKPRDVDLLIRPEDAARIAQVLREEKYCWHDFRKAFCSPHGVRIDIHWHGKETEVDKKTVILQLPDPMAIKVDTIDGLPVAALVPLIEMKLDCELRRQEGQPCNTKHRDDVLALIRLKHLEESYADNFASPVQDLFRQLVKETQTQTQGHAV